MVETLARRESLRLATPGHLGDSPEERLATARLLGLAPLTSRFLIEAVSSGPLSTPPAWSANFHSTLVWLRGRLAAREEGEDEGLPGTVPALVLQRHVALCTRVLDRGREVLAVDANVASLGTAVAVAGEPHGFAAKLTTLLVDRLGLRLRRDLADVLPELTLRLAGLANPPPRDALPEPPDQPPAATIRPEGSPLADSRAPVVGSEGEREARPAAGHPASPGASNADSPGEPRGHDAGDREARLHVLLQRRSKIDAEIRACRALGVLPAVPDAEQAPTGVAGPPRSDTPFRAAAVRFELDAGRHPVEKPPDQEGHDLDSYAHPAGHPERRLVRRIEVKGRRGRWEGDETVEVSRRQFSDARGRIVEPGVQQDPDFDYWVYVVEESAAGLRVLPIKNPAFLARRFELRAATWRDLAHSGPGSAAEGGPRP